MMTKNDIVQLKGSPKLYYVIKVNIGELIIAHGTDNNIATTPDMVANHWALQE